MEPLVVFAVGMAGALAPEIVRLYTLRQQGQAFTVFYFVISLLFAALGGLVAIVLPATTLWGAFYAGISAPVIVSAALKKGLGQRNASLRNPSPAIPTQPSFRRFIDAL